MIAEAPPQSGFAGTVLSLLACHNVEDIREVLVGVGLQVVRLVTFCTFSNYRNSLL